MTVNLHGKNTESAEGQLRERLQGLSPLIVALDFPDLGEALSIARSLKGYVHVVKVGLELFSSAGPEAVIALKEEGFEIFLDLKLSDIPNTVERTCRALVALGPLFVSLHAMGGTDMLRAACIALHDAEKAGQPRGTHPAAVTVLTSLDAPALRRMGFERPVEETVVRLASIARDAGIQTLVASPLEIVQLRRTFGSGVVIITPGIRPSGVEAFDQSRISTPGEAVRLGADFIVVGRVITKAPDAAAAARGILEEVDVARRGSPQDFL